MTRTTQAVQIVLWVLVLVGVWIATLTTVNGVEILVAAVVATPVAVLVVAVRRVLVTPQRPRASWARWLLLLPGAVLGDTARLVASLVRSRHPTTRRPAVTRGRLATRGFRADSGNRHNVAVRKPAQGWAGPTRPPGRGPGSTGQVRRRHRRMSDGLTSPILVVVGPSATRVTDRGLGSLSSGRTDHAGRCARGARHEDQ